jgi:serine phosphatase RsbU (regulator of sigma subunit)
MALAIEAPELHATLQATLVPPVMYSGILVEAYGRTVPKDQVGGDLADLVSHGHDVIAYVMDASGHGLRAGVLMGMAKAAFRYGLLLRQPLERLVRDINSVLSSIEERNMYLTLTALRFNGKDEAEYISAGHVPLLQYQRRTGRVLHHSMAQFPLGMFGGVEYVSRRLACEPGDVFALVTDGVVEIGEDSDADSGLERLAAILEALPGGALPDVMAAMLAEATGAGVQQDDATVLLVRCTEDAQTDCSLADMNSARTRLETWLKLLDELAEELSVE